MLSRREVFVRTLALLQRKTLIETKKSHIKMLKTALFDCAINEKCCSVNGGWGISSLFVPAPGDLTAQESPPPEICHPRQKNANARGSARVRGGGVWAKLELTDALGRENSKGLISHNNKNVYLRIKKTCSFNG